MSFTPALPAPARPTGGDGYNFSIRANKGGLVAVLFISAAAQERDFGGSLIGRRLAVSVGRGQDEGRLLLQLAPEGGIEATSALKGSVRLRLKPWDLLPRAAQKGGSCARAPHAGEGAVIILPRWADGKESLRAAPKGA